MRVFSKYRRGRVTMLVTWILPDPGYYSIRRDISKFSCVITMAVASHVSNTPPAGALGSGSVRDIMGRISDSLGHKVQSWDGCGYQLSRGQPGCAPCLACHPHRGSKGGGGPAFLPGVGLNQSGVLVSLHPKFSTSLSVVHLCLSTSVFVCLLVCLYHHGCFCHHYSNG